MEVSTGIKITNEINRMDVQLANTPKIPIKSKEELEKNIDDLFKEYTKKNKSLFILAIISYLVCSATIVFVIANAITNYQYTSISYLLLMMIVLSMSLLINFLNLKIAVEKIANKIIIYNMILKVINEMEGEQ